MAGGVAADWTSDGQIVFSTGSAGIFTVTALGGQPREIIATEEGIEDIHDVHVLPDGNGILSVLHPAGGGAFILALHRDGETRVLLDGANDLGLAYPIYDPRGYILLRMRGRETTWGLWAVPFDSAAGTIGEPFLFEQGAGEASLADDGALATVKNAAGTRRASALILDANGQPGEVVIPNRDQLWRPTISPDGRYAAFMGSSGDGGDPQLWIRDLARGTETQLTSVEGNVNRAYWSSDGSRIFLAAWNRRLSEYSIYWVRPDGSAPATLVDHSWLQGVTGSDDALVVARSPGSDRLDATQRDNQDVWLVPPDEPGAGRLLLSEAERLSQLALSPDGRYVLYVQFPNRRTTVYLARFPEFDQRVQVSLDHDARYPTFANDGSTIYYRGTEGDTNRVFRVSFDPRASPKLGRPEPLFDLPAEAVEIAPDPRGNRFLVTMREQLSESEVVEQHRSIAVVQNWTSKIEQR